RQASGVQRARQALRHGPAGGHAAAADDRQRARAGAGMVARRAMDRLRHVDRSRRSCRENPCGRARQSAAPHARARVLRSSGVVATSSNYVYLVTLPLVGAAPPAINVADTAAAAFPVHRLTRIGGDFIGWTTDANTVYWSVGRSFFRYNPALGDSLAKAKARA